MADVAVVPTQALGYDVWTLEDVAGIVEEARALNEGDNMRILASRRLKPLSERTPASIIQIPKPTTASTATLSAKGVTTVSSP